MAKVALCWELGAGLGHLLPLAEFAHYFKAAGHTCTLYSRYPNTYRNLPGLDDCGVVQAPYAHNHEKQLDVYNYSGLLRLCGYNSESELSPLLNNWINLFKENKTELVVADHSPTAVLAAYLLDIPCVMTGNGFSVPPAISPCPNLRPWESVSDAFLAASDTKIRGTINASLVSLGFRRKRLNNLSELFMRTEQIVATHPLLDHYLNRKPAKYINIRNPKAIAVAPQWPNARGEKIFVYFNSYSPSLMPLIRQLVQIGRPTLAVVPRAPASLAASLAGSNVKLSEDLVDIDIVAQKCKTIISHGGQQGTYDFLSHGIPSIVLPDVLERTLLAYRIGQAQLGFAGTPDPRLINLAKMLSTVESNTEVWKRAAQFKQVATQGYSNLDDLLDRKLTELGLAD